MSNDRLRLAGLTAFVLVAATLAACGTSKPTDVSEPSSDPNAVAQQLKPFAACMREHGIANFPDPDDDGIDLGGTGIDRESAAFKAADRACEAKFPRPSKVIPTKDGPAPGWDKVSAGDDCACSDGSAFHFWVRRANPKKVLLYFDGGGACFTAELCDPAKGDYNVTAESAPEAAGVFDFADKRNPFADYSVVFVPYCTADVFLGNTATTYKPGRTIHHKGFANGSAALDRLVKSFPQATDVVVAGASAGSVAAPLYGGIVAGRLPKAKVTAIADGSGAYPDTPAVNARLTKAWKTGDAIGALTGSASTPWSIPGLFALAGSHHRNLVLARHDYAYDAKQALRFPQVNLPTGDLLARMDANERTTEKAGVNLLSFTAPGNEHVALNGDQFYSETVEGQALVDWVTKLVRGERVDDVHCTDCRSHQ